MQNWLFLIMITCSIVPTAASKGDMCTTENNDHDRETPVRSDMGPSWMVGLGLVNSIFPNLLELLVYTAQLFSLFSKEKRKSGWRKSCCCKTERNKSKMENRKRKGFSIPTVITLIYPRHIQNKSVCKQQAIQSQTTTNCNPEMSIRTCIHMAEKRTNGVWLFQLTTASQCLQKDLTNTL